MSKEFKQGDIVYYDDGKGNYGIFEVYEKGLSRGRYVLVREIEDYQDIDFGYDFVSGVMLFWASSGQMTLLERGSGNGRI